MTKDNIKKILIQNKIKKDFIDNEIVELIKTILDNNSNFATAQNIDEFIYTLYIVIEKSKISTLNVIYDESDSALNTSIGNSQNNNSIFNYTDTATDHILDNYTFELKFGDENTEVVYIQSLIEKALKEKLLQLIGEFEKTLKNTIIQISDGSKIDFYNNHNLLHIFGLPYPYILHKICDTIIGKNPLPITFDKDKVDEFIGDVTIHPKNSANNNNKIQDRKKIEILINNLISDWEKTNDELKVKNDITIINSSINKYYKVYKDELNNDDYKKIMEWIDTTKCISNRINNLKFSKEFLIMYDYINSYDFYLDVSKNKIKAISIKDYIKNNCILSNYYIDILVDIGTQKIEEIDNLNNKINDNIFEKEFNDFIIDYNNNGKIKNILDELLKDKNEKLKKNINNLISNKNKPLKNLFIAIYISCVDDNLTDYEKYILNSYISEYNIGVKKEYITFATDLIIDYLGYKEEKDIIFKKEAGSSNGKRDTTFYLYTSFATDLYGVIKNTNNNFLDIINQGIWNFYNANKSLFIKKDLNKEELEEYLKELKPSVTLDDLNNNINNLSNLESVLTQLPRNNILNLEIIEQIKSSNNNIEFQTKYNNLYNLIRQLPNTTKCLTINTYNTSINNNLFAKKIDEIYEICDLKISWDNIVNFSKRKSGFTTDVKPSEKENDPQKYINYLVIFKKLLECDLIPKEVTPIYTKVFWKLKHIKNLFKIKDASFLYSINGNADLIIDQQSAFTISGIDVTSKAKVFRISSIKDFKDTNMTPTLYTVDIIFPIAHRLLFKKDIDLISNNLGNRTFSRIA